MKKHQTILSVAVILVITGMLFWFKKDQAKDDTVALIDTNQQNYTEQKIERNKVGPFSIGGSMPDGGAFAKHGYEVKEQAGEGLVEGAEGDPKGSAFVVSQSGEELFIIYPYKNNIINEFRIISPDFKTAEGISVGSTIPDFIEIYPEYRLWYTYVGGFFTLDTPEYKGIQFHLDENGFINKGKNLGWQEIDTLSPSDFSPETKITSIRIY